jgi:tetratricopeptide (TPR) repeat protein
LSSAYGFLLEYHRKRREHDKVIELYQVLFKLDPTNAWSRGNYANYLRTELGRFDEAIAYAREALSIMNYGAGRHILALCLYGKWADVIINQKRPESEAQKYYDEAFRLDPELDLVMAYEGSYAKGKALVQLLKSKGVSVDAKAEDGSTALMIASNTGRIDAVRLLLSLGANPNVKSVNGWTALLGAADEGYEEVVKVLLESGADPKQTFRNADAATLAERRGRAEIARMIRQYAADKK